MPLPEALQCLCCFSCPDFQSQVGTGLEDARGSAGGAEGSQLELCTASHGSLYLWDRNIGLLSEGGCRLSKDAEWFFIWSPFFCPLCRNCRVVNSLGLNPHFPWWNLWSSVFPVTVKSFLDFFSETPQSLWNLASVVQQFEFCLLKLMQQQDVFWRLMCCVKCKPNLGATEQENIWVWFGPFLPPSLSPLLVPPAEILQRLGLWPQSLPV